MTTKNLYPLKDKTGQITPLQQLNNNRLLLTLFLVAEGMLFGSLIYANFMVRSAQGQWPPVGVDRMDMALPILFTAALLISSLTAFQAIAALKRGDRRNLTLFLGATIALGIGYVVGMVILFTRLSFGSVYGAMFAALWVVHVAHAVVVLAFLSYVLWRAAQGKYSAESGYFPAEAATNLWHFLDVVWVVLFVVLYLV